MMMFTMLKCLHSAIVVWLLHMAVEMPSLGHCLKPGGTTNVTCVDTERRALLQFKHGLEIVDTNNNSWHFSSSRTVFKSLLSDWNAKNVECCRWEGIKCSENGRVMTLDLGSHIRSKYYQKQRLEGNKYYYDQVYIRGEIGHSLLDLQYLEFIDLSGNLFSGKIPSFIGSLKRLRYLDLSNNYFSGIVPHQLGNLSALESFDLGYNSDLEVDSLAWISGLYSLKYLNMNGVNLSSTTDWLQSITNLLSLTELYLNNCMLHSPSAFKHVNSTKPHPLRHLDLSNNDLEGEIPDFFSTKLSSLLTLDASMNRLINSSGFLQLGSTSLHELHLDQNKLTGLLPDLSKFPSLRVLNLAENEFKENLEQFIKQGSRLVELDVSSNSCNGVLREDNFQYHSELQVLILSYNSVELKFNPWWTPPFQLTVLKLKNCKLGPGFPHWLRAQSNLTQLDISNSGVSGVIPNWIGNISSRIQYLNISHNNNLSGSLPSFFSEVSVLDLSFNQLYGPIPSFSSHLGILDLSNNKFSSHLGILDLSNNKFSSHLGILDLSNNKFSGDISFLCSLKVGNLYFLNLQNNLLSGSLETCWESMDQLLFLNLKNNYFSGHLPHSIGNLSNIALLSLRNNSLSGELPSSLINCQGLMFLDLGENELSGVIPTWIGTSMQLLGLLSLHANRFTGNIPRDLCQLNGIQILDLSFNNISGMIPSCFNNFTAMVNAGGGSLFKYSRVIPFHSLYIDISYSDDGNYTTNYYATWIEWKGITREYVNQDHLKLLTLIDLSNNKLSGPIPPEIASLYELISLNLSSNTLTGIIPDNIGQLKKLESLDLSRNLLYGEIPRSMADLSSLSYLDLSSNNLSGKIQSSTQLQTFDAGAFSNNLMLCGPPTTNPCPGDKGVEDTPTNDPNLDQKSEAGIFHEDLWLYMSIGLGIIVGFWGFCGTLILKASWRQRYFEVLNNLMEGLYVAILVSISKLSSRVTS